jgi:hypothetical protein
MDIIMAKYAEVHLPTNPKKAFDNALLSSFWGVQIDGSKGLMRCNESRVWPLVLIGCRVVSLGLCSVGLLRSLAGSFISVLSMRRRMLAAMNLVFDAISASTSDNQILRLSGELKDELFTLLTLCTLAVVSLRAATLDTLRATDASDWGMAAVSTEIPANVARQAQRLGLSKSMWTRLLPPGKAWLRAKLRLPAEEELPGEDDVYDVHPFWEQLARSLVFVEEWRKPHPRAVHVNIGEVRALLLEESRLASRHVSVRIAYALDSQVALGSLVKGRASSKAINAELIKSIPNVLGSDLYGAYGYWPSKLNRADGPTRHAAPAAPDEPLPWWWCEVCEGNYERFDRWLAEVQAQVSTDHEPPSLQRLGEPVVLKTGRREAWENFKNLRRGKRADCSAVAAEPEVSAEGITLAAEAIAILETFSDKQVLFGKGVDSFKHPGALDLYTGVGGVARFLVRNGAPWIICFETLRSADEDVLLPENQNKILRLIQLKAVKVVGSALVCKSFSMAVTPAVRSPQYPRGLPWISAPMKLKVTEGNRMGDFQVEVVKACESNEPPTLFWFENPDGSYLWRQPKLKKRFSSPASHELCRVDFCRFGTPWRKRTRVGTNIEGLCGLRMFCSCTKEHVQLRGQHPTLKKAWTAVAQPYPRGFSKLLGSAIVSACNWSRRLNVSACARAGSLRIGEAKNPGPRAVRPARQFSLEEAPVQTWTSLQIGERRWQLFLRWCGKSLSGDVLQLFLAVPLFLGHAIRRYGDIDFMTGGSLMYFRHLVLVAQRKVPTLKPFSSICWDLASRWEKVEPTQHRPPVPEILVQALVALSWNLGWVRWSSVTLLCFHGVARVGEVLKCKRSDLLLPVDMMFESDSAFLLLRQTKTMYRQSARVQHLKISSEFVVRLLTFVFRGADREEQLFHGSPHVYRQRWNFLLKVLKVPAELHVTPGGLRGGGAVSWYRRGGNITDLLRAMRLKNISTLESYLQEVSAISLLTDLTAESKHSIRCAASIYWHLDHSLGI